MARRLTTNFFCRWSTKDKMMITSPSRLMPSRFVFAVLAIDCPARRRQNSRSEKVRRPSTAVHPWYKQHVGSYASSCETTTMAEDANDDGRDDATAQLPIPDGQAYANSYDAELDKVMGILARKQKILAKIMCVPGKKTYVAEWMKQTFEIIMEADPDVIIVTPSGLTINNLTEFPTGKKFKDAFMPIQSGDKKISMNFTLRGPPPPSTRSKLNTAA
jgi:hypothetical protein